MLLLVKLTEVTLEYIIGVATDVVSHNTFFEIKDSLYVFNQIEWGKEFRITTSVLIN